MSDEARLFEDAVMKTIRGRVVFAAAHPILKPAEVLLNNIAALNLAINLGDRKSMIALMERGIVGSSDTFRSAAAAPLDIFVMYIGCNGHLAYDDDSELLEAEDIDFGTEESRTLYAKLVSLM